MSHAVAVVDLGLVDQEGPRALSYLGFALGRKGDGERSRAVRERAVSFARLAKLSARAERGRRRFRRDRRKTVEQLRFEWAGPTEARESNGVAGP